MPQGGVSRPRDPPEDVPGGASVVVRGAGAAHDRCPPTPRRRGRISPARRPGSPAGAAPVPEGPSRIATLRTPARRSVTSSGWRVGRREPLHASTSASTLGGPCPTDTSSAHCGGARRRTATTTRWAQSDPGLGGDPSEDDPPHLQVTGAALLVRGVEDEVDAGCLELIESAAVGAERSLCGRSRDRWPCRRPEPRSAPRFPAGSAIARRLEATSRSPAIATTSVRDRRARPGASSRGTARAFVDRPFQGALEERGHALVAIGPRADVDVVWSHHRAAQGVIHRGPCRTIGSAEMAASEGPRLESDCLGWRSERSLTGIKGVAVGADLLRRPRTGVVVLLYHRVGGVRDRRSTSPRPPLPARWSRCRQRRGRDPRSRRRPAR